MATQGTRERTLDLRVERSPVIGHAHSGRVFAETVPLVRISLTRVLRLRQFMS
jgi:hypothetical protein